MVDILKEAVLAFIEIVVITWFIIVVTVLLLALI